MSHCLRPVNLVVVAYTSRVYYSCFLRESLRNDLKYLSGGEPAVAIRIF